MARLSIGGAELDPRLGRRGIDGVMGWEADRQEEARCCFASLHRICLTPYTRAICQCDVQLLQARQLPQNIVLQGNARTRAHILSANALCQKKIVGMWCAGQHRRWGMRRMWQSDWECTWTCP